MKLGHWLNQRATYCVEVLAGYTHHISAPSTHRKVDQFGGLYSMQNAIVNRMPMPGLSAPPVLQSQSVNLSRQTSQQASIGNASINEQYAALYLNLRAPAPNETMYEEC